MSLGLIALALALGWCWLALRVLLGPPPLPDLPPAGSPGPSAAVSVLVAVRNERSRILDRSLLSLLSQEYDAFDVIAVDDHSEDGSHERLLELSATQRRLRVEQATPDQRGKRAALAQAEREASGAWLLFTDADVVLTPDALSRGMALAQREGLDAVSLLPRTMTLSFWEQVALAATAWVAFTPRGLAGCNDDRGPVGLAAAGPYLLVRRSAYAAIGGYDALAQEVLIDVALARRLRQSGFRYRYLRSDGCVATRMYRSLGEIWQGFGKNAFMALDRRPGRAAGAVLGCAVVALPLPLLAASLTRSDLQGSLSALAAVLAMAMAQAGAARFMGSRLRPLPLLLVGAGAVLWAGVVAVSAWRDLSGRGATWKGRHVDTARREEAVEIESRP